MEGEKRPGNEITRRKFMRDIRAGIVAEVGAMAHTAYVRRTDQTEFQTLFGDFLIFIGGMGLVREASAGMRDMDDPPPDNGQQVEPVSIKALQEQTDSNVTCAIIRSLLLGGQDGLMPSQFQGDERGAGALPRNRVECENFYLC